MLLLAVCGLAAITSVRFEAAGQPETQKRVLVLHQLRRDSILSASMDDVYRKMLGDGLGAQLDYYSEYIDQYHFNDAKYQPALRDYLRTRYAGRPFDVVIATTTATLQLARDAGHDLFPGSAIVFHAGRGMKAPPSSTGVLSAVDLGGTLAMALALHPQVTHVAVISGASAFDKGYGNLAREQFRRFNDRVRFSYLYGQPLEVLQREVAGLSRDSLVFYISFSEDGAGRRVMPIEVLDKIAAIAPVPVYGAHENMLDHGIVGGRIYSATVIAQHTARLALRVLSGESPERIPVTEVDPYVTAFDWRQLRRWGISESTLPDGSVVLYRELTAWHRYRGFVAAAVILIVVQAGLIAALLVQRRQRQAAEHIVRASESALRSSHARVRDLAGQLLTAQEAERTRIARDLHDDACQEVARVAVDVSRLRQMKGRIEDAVVQETLVSVQRRTADVAEHLRLVSHDLHPTVLQHLGLVAALQAHCAEFERTHGVQVTFSAPSETEPANHAVSLTLFRIAQEALRNASKHGHARRARVSLVRADGHLTLVIADDGQGFDAVAARANGGLGLVSIEERARLLKGQAVVRSRPQEGTIVEICIPDEHPAAPKHVGSEYASTNYLARG
ncbi:MAG TPA: ATP-binding protein [Vicinamibacterales bacterium]|nr:ATP-binding protein [Vicinamibacterales bacterium]